MQHSEADSLFSRQAPQNGNVATALGPDPGLRALRKMMVHCAIVAGGLMVFFLFFNVLCEGGRCNVSVLRIANTLGLGTLILAFGVLAMRPLRHDPAVIFTPAFPFVVSTAFFFGFGSLSTFMVDDLTQRFVMAGAYFIDERGLLRTNVLTMFGVMVLLLSMAFASRFRLGGASTVSKRFSIQFLGLLFLGLGLFIKFALILPSRWEMTDWVAPGILTNLAQLSDLGFALVAYCSAKGGRKMWLLFWLLWPPYLAVSLLEFTKTATIFAILLPAIGAYLAHRRLVRLIPWLLGAALLFGVMQNINTAARNAVISAGGGEDRAPFGVRLNILVDTLSGVGSQARNASVLAEVPKMWWVRLNYSGPQLRAMELYDSGDTADWVVSPLLYFVPRILWPDKPSVASPGMLFNRQVSGSDTTIGRVAITIYAEGYWFSGWLGTALFSAMTGLILGAITRQTYRQISARNFIYLPVAFLGMQMGGLGVYGFFQTNILGALPVYLAFFALISIVNLAVRSASRHRKGQLHTRPEFLQTPPTDPVSGRNIQV